MVHRRRESGLKWTLRNYFNSLLLGTTVHRATMKLKNFVLKRLALLCSARVHLAKLLFYLNIQRFLQEWGPPLTQVRATRGKNTDLYSPKTRGFSRGRLWTSRKCNRLDISGVHLVKTMRFIVWTFLLTRAFKCGIGNVYSNDLCAWGVNGTHHFWHQNLFEVTSSYWRYCVLLMC